MGRITLVTGGARSGKSAHALKLVGAQPGDNLDELVGGLESIGPGRLEVSSATTVAQQSTIGTVADLSSKVSELHDQGPGLVVVGNVVNLINASNG